MEPNVMNHPAYRPSYTPNNNHIPVKSYTEQVIGMAYVPWQHWHSIYAPCKALSRGTIFQELDKPFEGGCMK